MPRGKGKAEEEKRVWAWKGSGWAGVRMRASREQPVAGSAGGEGTQDARPHSGALPEPLRVPGTKRSTAEQPVEKRH